MKIVLASFFDPAGPPIGAVLRSRSILRGLDALSHQVSVVSVRSGMEQKSDAGLSSTFGYNVARRFSRLLGVWSKGLPFTGVSEIDDKFRTMLKRQIELVRPDIIISDMLWAWPELEWVFPVPVIYNEHNIEFRVAESIAKRESRRLYKYVRHLEANFVKRLEMRAWRNAQQIWAVSNSDKELHTEDARRKCWVIPNSLPIERSIHDKRMDKKYDVLFVGSINYYPNSEGLKWFLVNVWHKYRMGESGFKLAVVGGCDSKPNWICHHGVEWLGYVEDILEVYKRTRIVIAPIFSGGGTKYKVLEAMQLGLPVIGSEDSVLGLEGGHSVFVAKTAAEWYERIIRKDCKCEEKSGEANRIYYMSHYSAVNVSDKLSSALVRFVN
jgi:glycosyltransferase involved in cell wall biosynthesis